MTSDVVSNSASSTLLLLLGLAVAGLVRETLGMVKRSPLPYPPLEMSRAGSCYGPPLPPMKGRRQGKAGQRGSGALSLDLDDGVGAGSAG
jgi:hypothetical protein